MDSGRMVRQRPEVGHIREPRARSEDDLRDLGQVLRWHVILDLRRQAGAQGTPAGDSMLSLGSRQLPQLRAYRDHDLAQNALCHGPWGGKDCGRFPSAIKTPPLFRPVKTSACRLNPAHACYCLCARTRSLGRGTWGARLGRHPGAP